MSPVQPTLGTNLSLNPVSMRGESFRARCTIGGGLGHFIDRVWGVEAEFTHLKVFANLSHSSTVTGLCNARFMRSTEPNREFHSALQHRVNLIVAKQISNGARGERVMDPTTSGARAASPGEERRARMPNQPSTDI